MRVNSQRLKARFDALKEINKPGLISFITAGDPDLQTSERILQGLPEAGTDIIELGMPFSDPMADGPTIQASSQRALENGQTMALTLEMVGKFRENNDKTPIVLMGYYNPIYIYGNQRFAQDAAIAGVDGLIIVDLPPEEDEELRKPLCDSGIDIVRLITPTSDESRLPKLVSTANGFLYYVSVTGITGTKSPAINSIQDACDKIRQFSSLPIAVGFGIKTSEQAKEIAQIADAAVVGSAIIQKIEDEVLKQKDNESFSSPNLIKTVLSLVSTFSKAVKMARS